MSGFMDGIITEHESLFQRARVRLENIQAAERLDSVKASQREGMETVLRELQAKCDASRQEKIALDKEIRDMREAKQAEEDRRTAEIEAKIQKMWSDGTRAYQSALNTAAAQLAAVKSAAPR